MLWYCERLHRALWALEAAVERVEEQLERAVRLRTEQNLRTEQPHSTLAHAGFGHGDAGWPVEGAAGRYDTRAVDDHFTQAGNLFRLLTDDGKRNLIENIAGSLSGADAAIQDRQIAHFLKADPAYGQGVAEAIRKLQNRA